jgi:tripartite-type tricarboxylate transporter receptor subunit TctC
LESARRKKTSTIVLDRLNREINEALANPAFAQRMVELGGSAMAMSREDFGKLIAQETGKWSNVIRTSGIKAE